LTFRLRAFKFQFRAVESVYFPSQKAGNVLRGALWPAVSRLSMPDLPRPSGLVSPPRPFVIRAAHLDGRCFEPGESFSLDLHLFDPRSQLVDAFVEAFVAWRECGLGPRRGRVELLNPSNPGKEICIDLRPAAKAAKCTVAFMTPTELKGADGQNHGTHVPFGVLFHRVRDRIGTLRALYGEGPLPVDFHALGQRAREVNSARSTLEYREVLRRSSRTGMVHGIGGFTGEVDYEGDLTEFMPWLQAAVWTGVGRHTVWGNGAIGVSCE
jgi:hypothetical protein